MLLIRNIESSLVPLGSRFRNGGMLPRMVPQLWLINNNLASSRLSSTANDQPKGWMERYELFLSRRYPKAYAVHRMVMNGMIFIFSFFSSIACFINFVKKDRKDC